MLSYFTENKVVAVEIIDPDNCEFDPGGCDADPDSLGNNVYECVCTDEWGNEWAAYLSHEAIVNFHGHDAD